MSSSSGLHWEGPSTLLPVGLRDTTCTKDLSFYLWNVFSALENESSILCPQAKRPLTELRPQLGIEACI